MTDYDVYQSLETEQQFFEGMPLLNTDAPWFRLIPYN